MEERLISLATDAAYVLCAILILFCGKITLNVLTPYRLDDEFASKDNPAFGLSLVGYYIGILIVFIGASLSFGDAPTEVSLFVWKGILKDIGWALLGIPLLNLARVVTDRIVFRTFSTRKEIIEDRNVGMGAIKFGVYIGSALVLAGALSGRGGGLVTALAFFALGQMALIAVSWIYQYITKYDFHDEIEKDNVAAGVAYSGARIAVGIVLMRGTCGDFYSWADNLLQFAWYFFCAVLLLFLGRFVDYSDATNQRYLPYNPGYYYHYWSGDRSTGRHSRVPGGRWPTCWRPTISGPCWAPWHFPW